MVLLVRLQSGLHVRWITWNFTWNAINFEFRNKFERLSLFSLSEKWIFHLSRVNILMMRRSREFLVIQVEWPAKCCADICLLLMLFGKLPKDLLFLIYVLLFPSHPHRSLSSTFHNADVKMMIGASNRVTFHTKCSTMKFVRTWFSAIFVSRIPVFWWDLLVFQCASMVQLMLVWAVGWWATIEMN